MPNYLSIASGRQQKLAPAWLQASRTEEIIAFHRTVTLTSASAGTAVSLISEAEVPAGFAVFVQDWTAKVNGGTLWGTVSTVKIQDTNGTPADFSTMAVAGLAANAFLKPNSSNVTVDSAMALGTGGTAGKGLQVKANANGTGSPLVVTVTGYLKRA